MALQLAQGRALHLSSEQPPRLHVVGTSAFTAEADLPPPDADSVWSPPAAALEGLPYGGCLQTAVEKDDRNAVRAIQRQWGMHEGVVLPSDADLEARARAVAQGPLPPSREASGAPAPRRSASESAAAEMGLTREEARQMLQEHRLAREGLPSPAPGT